MLHVDEVVNCIKGLGEELKDTMTVKNVLRSLLPRFDTKVLAIEDAKYLNTL